MNYITLTEYYERIENSSKRLDKIDLISKLLKETDLKNIKEVILLLQGKVFANWDEQKIGVASRLVLKAINISTGISIDKAEQEWKRTGDLGLTAENLIATKKQATLFSEDLTIQKVFSNLEKLGSLEGAGTVGRKVQLIAELMTSAKSNEAKYITRTILGDLRVGASTGTLRDAIVKAYFPDEYENRDSETKERFKELVALIQHAYDLTNDFGEVVLITLEKGEAGLKEVSLVTGKPVNPMLFPKAKDPEDGFTVTGKPAMLEYKYDGFRVQAHKNGDKVDLFTRRLEKVTIQFPEVVDRIKKHVKAEKCILDSEVLGFEKDTGRMLPFQQISQRIRRKHDIDDLVKKVPVVMVIFDMLQINDQSLLTENFEKRRELLEKTVDVQKGEIELSQMIKSGDVKEAEQFYQAALFAGHEGMMMKSLSAGYKPGARIGYAVKVKPVLEPLDLAIVGAEWGKGKRTGWLTSFILACRSNSGDFIEMGKVGTGIKELDNEDAEEDTTVTFKKFTEMLKPLVISESGTTIKVKPEVIVEVDYEEIQKSSNYRSGYALRFPRIKRIRDDLKEPSYISDVERIYQEQRGRGTEQPD